MSVDKIILRSESRNSNLSASSSNLTFLFQPNIYLKDRRKLKLEYLLLPGTMFNINTNNNKLDFKVGVTSYVATLSVGIYDAITLASTIQTAMTSQVSNSWSVTYDAIKKAYTFAGTSSFQLMLATGANASSTNNIWEVIGFASSNGLAGIDTSAATSTASTQIVQLSLPLAIYMKINLGSNCVSTDNDNFAYVIPNTSQAGSYIEYKWMDNFEQIIQLPESVSAISRMDILLSDRLNRAINLNNGEWLGVLSIEC